MNRYITIVTGEEGKTLYLFGFVSIITGLRLFIYINREMQRYRKQQQQWLRRDNSQFAMTLTFDEEGLHRTYDDLKRETFFWPSLTEIIFENERYGGDSCLSIG